MWIFSAIANAVGANYIGDANYITLSFEKRVQEDGGVFESPTCLVSILNSLS
jgi:hypothetical protein